MKRTHWPLASKLLGIGLAFLLLALLSIAMTLWVSWQLEGGAAAVNEAGRLRMQTYRMALQAQPGASDAERRRTVEAMEAGLERLRVGDPSRPLFVPWNAHTRLQFADLQARWPGLREPWQRRASPAPLEQVDAFVARVDAFVASIEQQLSDWTAVLRGFQFAMVLLAIASTVVLMYTGHLFVLEPLQRLRKGLAQVADGNFAARVEKTSDDEFGQLAQGFNTMAAHLQALYGQLEAKVAEKTESLETKRQRLAALYEVSAFIAKAESLPALAQGFAPLMRRIAQADAIAVRWSDEGNERYLMLASDGLPAALSAQEQCLQAGHCHCGQPVQQPRMRVIPINSSEPPAGGRCSQLGYRMLLTLPVALHQRVFGEIDLFYAEPREVGEEERAQYETLASHLAGGMESLRAAALDKEAAVAQERTLLAQELHDSIAQSLVFLKIQVALLRQAMKRSDDGAMQRSVDELDAGVRECYGDVRELLLHFRTRTNDEDIATALRATLQKFEHQSGLNTELQMHGHGVPLPADVQIQVLHVLQEALSNIRKHAQASHVVLTVEPSPVWRFQVKDDGCGFDPQARQAETHVGLRIMRERAARVGAAVELASTPGQGTCVTLTLKHQPDEAAAAGTST
ncbi:type IV pili methyl-accepting chemotaxis transducer N-terminal domain-containing protein [Aquabacterium sp. A7-Y]|uniref:type IV pili methyl-accepting chemotaxis transducer N-terminal domain-containing protein n=1 Tax=Aquabacterium sp. A7-Y TaxID=1349605 RepID=UPI00223D8572|nr:type IV pili methyl-accepting chemotaxis transducer N-terminal domain-containing protein [Aquabacterium sp. A7-Y]MCW7541611.1 type IV pili methyl-accepting chemotaxis transducer N-terminal domain-containing protein [Aquabacterium sp. A7-Y]